MLTVERVSEHAYLVTSSSPELWKCNGIVVTSGAGTRAAFIDCSFNAAEFDALLDKFGDNVDYYVTHMHVDHVQYLHVAEARGIPIYCPAPDHEYVADLSRFARANGIHEAGFEAMFRDYIDHYTKFRPVTRVTAFSPGAVFDYKSWRLASIPLPGHSPGHVGFEIRPGPPGDAQPVLFAADIGIDGIGPWYCFKYCHLGQYRASIARLEAMYARDSYVLLSSHGPAIRARDPDIFTRARQKIEAARTRLVRLLETTPRDVEALVGKGVYYRTTTLAKMEAGPRQLYLFWESWAIRHLLRELEAELP